MQDFIAELRWRGMIHDIIPGTEEQLKKEKTAGYVGFDPTAPSLHVGNLATVMLLRRLQLAGHKPVVVIGGATGMVGDPSGKLAERKLLSEEELRYNQACISKQLSYFLEFSDQPHGAVLLNNLDWFKDMGLLQFLRETGKHLAISYMIAKDSVKRRMEAGISFTEFTYQLLQGYDFYYLYTRHNVKLQMGGTDQWGNLTTGAALIRKKVGGDAFALTTPLLTKADGSKFGKTEQGALWLDPTMTSPYAFYQFWMNCADEEVPKLVKIFTQLSQIEIEHLIKAHDAAPHQRILQQALAKELTITVHSELAYKQAARTAQLLFGELGQGAMQTLNEQELHAVLSNVLQITISKEQLSKVTDVTELVSSATQGMIFQSKGEARRMIQAGGLRINETKVTDPHQKPPTSLLQDRYILIQQGKKHHYLIVVT